MCVQGCFHIETLGYERPFYFDATHTDTGRQTEPLTYDYYGAYTESTPKHPTHTYADMLRHVCTAHCGHPSIVCTHKLAGVLVPVAPHLRNGQGRA